MRSFTRRSFLSSSLAAPAVAAVASAIGRAKEAAKAAGATPGHPETVGGFYNGPQCVDYLREAGRKNNWT